MKYLLSVILLSTIPCLLYAQCVSTADKITGRTNFRTEPVLVKEGAKEFGSILNNVGELKALVWVFIVSDKDQYCFEKGSDINILFKDGTRMILVNSADFNCDGKVNVGFGDMFGRKKELNKLASTSIEAIRLVGFKHSFDQEIGEEDGIKMMEDFKCMAEKVGIKLKL